MGDSKTREEFPSQDQRAAVCNGQFEKGEGKPMLVGFGGFRFHKREACCGSCSEGCPCEGKETQTSKEEMEGDSRCPEGQVWRGGKCVPKPESKGMGAKRRRRRAAAKV